MSALTIAAMGETSRHNYWSTLASLPITFAPSREGARTDVVSIAGVADWASTATAAIEDGVGAIVVSRPGPASSARVRELVDLAESNAVAIEFADDYAGNPVFEKHGTEMSAHLQAQSALVVTQVAPRVSRQDAVLSVLRTTRALGLAADISSVIDRQANILVNGTAGTLTLAASVTRGTAGIGQRIQGLGYSKNLDIRLYSPSTARPATVLVTSLAGENKLSTVYETAERAAWRRVAANHSAPAGRTTALREILSDLEALEQL